MAKKIHFRIIVLLSLIPFSSFATHIVGGSLTYIYNGGSSYTIKLKLYKDCGPGAAGFPANVTISVLGNNGLPFTPSKDITINLGTVTNIPSNLNPCAVSPNPMPCVQEGVYSITVNNLPPNAGGYHLYYQVVARNLSLTNVNGACNCIGESFYTNIPGMSVSTIWNENFTLPNNTTIDNGATSWSIAAGTTAPSSAGVSGNLFEITGANNGKETWTSQVVNITSCLSTNLSVDLSENGNLDPNDSILVYYRINGGALIPFPTNGAIANDFTSAVATANGLTGTTIQIVIRVHYDGTSNNGEKYEFDNVTISCVANDFKPNSNPVFNLFPPLFICVNQPFSFNHAATDTNGDSLVYSLYRPFDGDVGVGPLDPTFPANTASFTPVTYLAGYNFTNPLGPGPFNLNPTTGLLTGTPGTLGQFVVGVMVKEYRNGVYLSQTLRDFQFNVLNCPTPPPTLSVPNVTVNNGCSAKLTATGVSSVSTTWTSIFPGAPGAYNSFLACTAGCLSNTVTAAPTGTPPSFVDYVVCGTSTSCSGAFVCDTFRVKFNPTLAVTILPSNPTLCFGQTSTTLTAVGSGGTPGFTYLWNNVNPSQTINVGVGTYNVQLRDATGCPPVFNSVTVTAFTVAISANAGSNQTRCTQNPIATLNGIVTGATGGIWSGGSGSFTPNNTTLANMSYSPTPAEVASGSISLYLTTTGNGSCPSKKDTVVINYSGFTGVVTPSVNNVSCFGSNNGSATVNLTGGFTPYTYFWNISPTQTTSTANNLPIGTYSVNIKDGIGCTQQTTVNISQPPILSINSNITNVSCFGTSTGSISATPVGGTSPYTFSWTPGGLTTSSITGLAAGNYTTTVTDTKGCLKTATFTVTQPPGLAITFTKTNVSCFSGNNASVNTTITGGTSPYTYSWIPGGVTSQNVTGLQAGTCTLTVTDNLNCPATQTMAITQPTILTAIVSTTNESCNYLNNGSASLTASGGTTPYTYSWLPGGQTTNSITNQPSGSYTVTVTDNKGCTSTSVATITEPTPLTVNLINQFNVSCFGGTDGSIGASPSGGTPNYTYSWTPGGSTSSTLGNIPIGTYTVKVTDSKSCFITNTVVIIQPSNLIINNINTNVSCNGGNNGSVALTPNGGTSPYQYFWSVGGQTTSSVTDLSAGNYSATVTDAKGCQKTSGYTISQPLPITITLTQTNVSCFNGSNGIVNTNVSGGTSPYTYSWSPGGQTSQNISGLQIGTYTLTVTDNLNCTATNTVTITQPKVLTAVTIVTDESCNYLNNGSATLTPSGGTAPYTYSWQPGGQITSSITGQVSGTYTVTVTDNKGCTTTDIAIISEPMPLAITFTDQINVSCFGGSNASIGSTISGGTPNYTYSWTPGGDVTNALFNITAGTYSLTIRDNNNCVAQNTISISQPTAAVTVSLSSVPPTCNGAANGSASAIAAGGTATYSYSWMPGSLSGQTISNISSGTYTVTATDINGCVTSNTVFVNEPAPILPVTTSTNSTCGNANGTGSVSVSGGIGPYNYQWQPTGGIGTIAPGLLAGAYTILVTDNNGCTAIQYLNINDTGGPVASILSTTNVTCYGGADGGVTASVTGGAGPLTYSWSPCAGSGPIVTGLTAGTYLVKVTDINGCTSLATTNPDITEPADIAINVVTSIVSCFAGTNGSATVSASGGTPSYTYTWFPSLTTGTVVNGLSANIYTVQAEDANNCLQTTTYGISQPTAALSIAVSSTSVSCFGGNSGTASSSALGGTSPYNYNWAPGNISGQNISHLIQGTYSITVTDIKGCITTNSVSVFQPTPILLTTASFNSNCGLANGQASVSASGGQGTYTYLWMPNGGTGTNAMGLLAGTYTVKVTDANNCITSTAQIVANSPGPTLTVSSTTNVSCYGGNDGSAFALVTGGTGPFTYTWTPLGGNGQTATGLSAGNYTVNITTANGCIASAATNPQITQPSLLFANIVTSNVSCFSGANGSATITADGGTPGYTYTWLPGGTTGSSVSGLTANAYSVIVKDANNCLRTFTYVITQPTSAVSASATSSAVSCFGGNNGTATVSATGGTSPYNYNWLPMSVNSIAVSGLTTGIYTVNVSDFKNCTTSTTVIVTQPTQSLSATANSVPTSCSGGSDGTATVTPVGGTSGYTYQWSPTGGIAQTASGLLPGNYIVTVNDANSCQTHVAVIVSSPMPVTGTLISTDAACSSPNGSISSQISGGIGPYTYSWSPGSITTSTIGGILPGTYTLQAKDFYGCIKTLTTTLINIPGPAVTLTSTSNVSCFGGSDGSAAINITQGTPAYTINWFPFGGNAATVSCLTAGIYTASVIDSRGCISSIPAIINEPGQVNISINMITNVSCFNGNDGSITVAASGGTPSYSYTWSTSVSGPTINNITAGSYTVNVSDSNNCPSSISMSISQPTSALNSAITSALNPACFNSTGSSSVSVSGGTAPYTYTWTTNPIQNGSTATNLVGGTYTVNIFDANGCSGSNTVTLVQPTQITSNAGVNDTICLGQSGVVTSSAIGGLGNYYFVWQPLSVTNVGTLNITPPSNTNYTVVAFDQNGCAGIPDTVQAVVFTLAPSNIQTFGLSPICPGQTSMISALASGNTGPISYNWNNGLGTGAGPFIVAPNNPTTYVVTVSNSCGASVSDSVVIAFNPPPTVLALLSGSIACIPSPVTFVDNSITGNINDPITTWLWDFGDGTTSTTQNSNHIYTDAGTYSVNLTVTTDGGCTNNNASSPIIVNAEPYPDAHFTVNSNVLDLPFDVLICTNQSTGATTYNWNFGDQGTSTLTDPSYHYSTVGIYQIQLIATSQFGCTDTTYAEIKTDADLIIPNAFTPNLNGPSGGYYTPGALNNDIFFPYASGVVEYKFQVFDRWGELIFETEDFKQGWDGYYRNKICQVAVYVWKAYVKLNNGKVFNKNGDVTLLK